MTSSAGDVRGQGTSPETAGRASSHRGSQSSSSRRKTDVSCVRSQSQGGGQTGAHTHIVSIISTGGFWVEREVNGVATSFLLNTGASATLLQQDTWERVNIPPVRREMTPCPEHRLISVDGSPLQVHGNS